MSTSLWFCALAGIFLLLPQVSGQATLSPQDGGIEAFLYIQNGRSNSTKDPIYVLWVPQPMLKYCLGRTPQECVSIDFCVRTTSRQVPQCQNLPVDISRIQRYPPETVPKRVLGITYFPLAPIKGWDLTMAYFHSNPKSTFDQLAPATRIKARIKFTRTQDDDSFDLLEVLAVPQ